MPPKQPPVQQGAVLSRNIFLLFYRYITIGCKPGNESTGHINIIISFKFT